METLITALLRGDEVQWPFTGEEAQRQFLDHTHRHGVLPLVARQLRRMGSTDSWPPTLRAAIAARARHHSVVEQLNRGELERVLDALAIRGVLPMLFKGAALAYTEYPHPCLRPRDDFDLLVDEPQVDAVAGVLDALGYSPIKVATGRLVNFQQTFGRDAGHGVRHACDVHWRISNRHAFAQLLSRDELTASASSISLLGNRADAPARHHALLIACMHRVAHHFDAATLIWLYDIHLLASSLTDAEATRFRQIAIERGLATICRRGLQLAQRHFGTTLRQGLREIEPGGREPLAHYLADRFRPIDFLLSDLRAVHGSRTRWRLLRQHLLPPRDYMRDSSSRFGSGPLPVLYLRRILRGASRWLRTVDQN